ncbi:MAG: GAF domain-containing protein [Anaerolineae bacterium]|nr:GAF domain-containing protein [Anaerolineae bacterium]
MNSLAFNQGLQYIAWAIASLEVIAGLYILLLNFWHTANRHVSLLLLLISVNTYALGVFSGATDIYQARVATWILAAVAPGVSLLLFIVAVALFRPQWLSGKWSWVWRVLYVLCVLPVVCTVIDVGVGLQPVLWYTGLEGTGYQGGVVGLFTYVDGLLAPLFRIITNLPILLLLVLLITIIVDKSLTRSMHNLALLMLFLLLGSVGTQVVPVAFWGEGTGSVLSSTIFALTYTYAGFRQMISERRLQHGRLQFRLTAIVLAVAIPLIVIVVVLSDSLAFRALNKLTDEQLRLVNVGLKGSVQSWVTLNTQVLQEMVSLPAIISMDPIQQEPVLKAIAVSHPQAYLVMTLDMQGMNVTRNDEAELRNYSDRSYFIGARAGRVTLEVIVSRTTGQPALAMAAPIKDAEGQIIGVGVIAGQLDAISQQVSAGKVGQTGEVYVVDGSNYLVAHSNVALVTRPELVEVTDFQPVMYLRQNGPGYLTFVDEYGERWHTYVDTLDADASAANGWGIIVQQQEAELESSLRAFRSMALLSIIVGATVLAGFVALAIGQAVQPVTTLTETAAAITAGDLSRTAPIESEDELGALARSFNSMTEQLRALIGSLEQRVQERTADLEYRSRYLQASSEVGRVVASILDTEQLIRQVVELIRGRFALYYVGLFLVDAGGEWAVLHAGTGDAGQKMLARKHRLKIGSGSMIGWCVAHEQPRIAQVAEADAVRQATTELPDTRSEAALPLRSRGKVLGALTVQSDQPNAFDETSLAVLQVMADQVAVALDNARLFAESQQAIETARQAYGELSRRAWLEMMSARQNWGFHYEQKTLQPVQGKWQSEMLQASQRGGSVVHNDTDEPALSVPLKLRDQVIGVIDLRRESPDQIWTEEDRTAVETMAEQLSLALESARLYQDTQRRAARERLVGEVTARVRETLDVDVVLQTAVRELWGALDLAEVEVRMGTGPTSKQS